MEESKAIEKFKEENSLHTGTGRWELILPSGNELVGKLKEIRAFQATVKELLVEGSDYGVIPGTHKPTMLKPGAEKICKLLNLCERYELMDCIRDFKAGIFHYEMRCRLYIIGTDIQVSEGVGEANSYESRYRYRWVSEFDLPPGVVKENCKKRGGKRAEFVFAIEKAQTTGAYGKSPEYWQAFKDAIDNKTATPITKKTQGGKELPAFEIDSTVYRVENEEIYDQVNTILKICKKRAFVDANLSVGRLSDLYTQDLEDREHDSGDFRETLPPLPDEPEAKTESKKKTGSKKETPDKNEANGSPAEKKPHFTQKEGCITLKQAQRFFTLAKGHREPEEIKEMLKNCRMEGTHDISTEKYEQWCEWAQGGVNSMDLWSLYNKAEVSKENLFDDEFPEGRE